jgi:hypothetical protein
MLVGVDVDAGHHQVMHVEALTWVLAQHASPDLVLVEVSVCCLDLGHRRLAAAVRLAGADPRSK